MEVEGKYDYINAGINISNTVRSTLGPKGMNKMIVKSEGNILTNDGATIIKAINFSNPIGELFKKLAENQEKFVGDGTTTTVVFAGQLLEKALELLNKKVHPTTIITGYNLARQETIKFLNEVKFESDFDPIIRTSFGSKISPQMVERLSFLLRSIDIKKLRMSKVENSDSNLTDMIKGYQLSGFTINDRMPSKIAGKIAILDTQTSYDNAKISLNSTEELDKYNNSAKNAKKQIINKLKALNVSCVFLTDTNPVIENFLTEENIMSIVVYKRNLIDNIAKATGAKVIGDTQSEYEKYLGEGEVIYEQEKQLITILNENSEVLTLVLHGSTKQFLDELERSVDDVVRLLRLDKNVVIGAGAVEIELANHLTEFAKKIGGKEQIAVIKFAEALECIPLILAENCGHDSMEVITLLKNQHSLGKRTLGVDANLVISDAKERLIF